MQRGKPAAARLRHWSLALLVLIALALCAAVLLALGRVETAPERFMPQAALDVPSELAGAAGVSNLVLAGISGGMPEARAATSRAMANALAGERGVRDVRNGAGAGLSRKRLEPLLPYRYIVSPRISAETFTPNALRRALKKTRQRIISAAGAVDRKWLAADPTGELRYLRDSILGAGRPQRRGGVWVGRDGKQALLVIELQGRARDIDRSARVLQRIRGVFRNSAADGGLALRLTGSAVFAVASRDLIRAEVRWLSIAASVLMATIVMLSFRSVLVLALVLVPLAGAILAGAAVVTLVFGAVHGIALAFGCTLLGVVVDYPLHLLGHRSPGEPARRAMLCIWPTLRLGALTTLLGYAAMALADMRGLAQLGMFAMSGLAAAALITRYLLPQIVPRTTGVLRGSRTDAGPLTVAPRVGPWILLATAALAVAIIGWRHERLWQNDLNALSPVPEDLRQVDASLREALGVADLRYLVTVRGEEAEEVLQRSEALGAKLEPLVNAGVVEWIEHPARLLPSRKTQRRRRAALPARAVLAARVERVSAALGFRRGAFRPFVEAVARARELEPLTPKRLRKLGLGELVASSLVESAGRWIGFVRLHGVHRPRALARWFASHAPAGVTFVDTKQRIETLLGRFREAALRHFGIGVVVIWCVLAIGLRSTVSALGVVAAPLVATLATVAALVAVGVPLSVFHLVSMLLVVGLGLDYALFFRRTVPDRNAQALTRRTLALCALSTLTVFGLLATSKLAVLTHIGTTVSLGAALAFVLAWLASSRADRGSECKGSSSPV